MSMNDLREIAETFRADAARLTKAADVLDPPQGKRKRRSQSGKNKARVSPEPAVLPDRENSPEALINA